MDRLETVDEDINIVDLRKNVQNLSRFVLKGREFRNAITTGRYLAIFKEKPLDFECLRHVMGLVGKFNKDLKENERRFGG
jgi:hypothetical protein